MGAFLTICIEGNRFSFTPDGSKQMFRCVEPQRATLIRVALDLFDSQFCVLPIRKPPLRAAFLLVEPRGIEPLSESNLERTSPGAVCYLHSLIPAGTNTLRESVAS